MHTYIRVIMNNQRTIPKKTDLNIFVFFNKFFKHQGRMAAHDSYKIDACRLRKSARRNDWLREVLL